MPKHPTRHSQASPQDIIGGVTTLLLMAIPSLSCVFATPIHPFATGLYILACASPVLIFSYIIVWIFIKKRGSRYSPASMGFLVAFLLGFNAFGDLFAVNMLMDKSPPDTRVVTIVDKGIGWGKRSKVFYIDNPAPAPLPFLQTRHTTVTIFRYYNRITPGVTRVELEFHKGYLGFTWIGGRWDDRKLEF